MGNIFSKAVSKLGNLLNPVDNILDYLKNLILDIFRGEVGLFRNVILNTPIPSGPFLDAFYGGGYGLAGELALFSVVIVVMLAMFIQKRLRDVPYAFFVAISLGFFGQLWFPTADGMIRFGNLLAHTADFYESTKHAKNGLTALLDVVNPLGVIVGVGILALIGGILILLMFISIVVVLATKFGMLIAFAASPLGQRAQQVLSWAVSLAVTCMMFVRAIMVFFMDLGEWAVDNMPLGTTSFGAAFYLIGAFLLAVAGVVGSVVVAHKAYAHVTGRVASKGRSQVEGNVSNTPKRRQEVDVRKTHNATRLATLVAGTTLAPLAGKPDNTRQTKASKSVRQGTKFIAKGVAQSTPAGKAAAAFMKQPGMAAGKKAVTSQPVQRAASSARGTHERVKQQVERVQSGQAPQRTPRQSAPEPPPPAPKVRPQGKEEYGPNGLAKPPWET